MSELCNYRAYVSLYCSLTNKKLKCYMLCTICPSVRAAQWRVQIPEILKAGQTAEAHTELCAFLRERRLIEKTGPPPWIHSGQNVMGRLISLLHIFAWLQIRETAAISVSRVKTLVRSGFVECAHLVSWLCRKVYLLFLNFLTLLYPPLQA